MNRFQQAVHEAVNSGMRATTQSVRGRIPVGGIDHKTWLCTVEIPNPKAGKHPSDDKVLTYYDVPLPHNPEGFVAAVFSLVNGGERAVTVGFRGGSMAHPYIINFGSFLNQFSERPKQRMDAKKPATPEQFTTAAPPFIGPPVPQGLSVGSAPPPPSQATPPSLAGSSGVASKSAATSQRSSAAAQGVLGRTTTVTVSPR